jgi:hypothetical protein
MLPAAAALALLAAVPPAGTGATGLAGAAGEGPGAGTRRPGPRLEIGLRLDPGAAAVAVAPAERPGSAPPACVADWCPARVELPGQPASAGKPHKTELVVALLDGAGIEPAASIAWFFVATGLRVDWSPANADASTAAAGGWGNLFVRLRLRIDAWNRPTVPVRPRERMRRERELAAQRAPGLASASREASW